MLDADPRLLSEEQQLQMARLNDKHTARLHALSTRAGIDQGQVTKRLHGVSTTSWLREGRGYSVAQAAGVVKEALRAAAVRVVVCRDLVWVVWGQGVTGPARADALVELAQTYADAHHSSSRGNDRARVSVTVDLDTLLSGIGWADTTCAPMSAQQLRLLACDGEIIPMVTGRPRWWLCSPVAPSPPGAAMRTI